jgi:hypothetical protein
LPDPDRGEDPIPIAAISASTRTQRPSDEGDFARHLTKAIAPEELADAILDLARPH